MHPPFTSTLLKINISPASGDLAPLEGAQLQSFFVLVKTLTAVNAVNLPTPQSLQ
uniref:Uncharacterized protein n=1 Tax=Moniliophthora roreri TaxID=221103 RepID=A0A0W0FA00_MONRR